MSSGHISDSPSIKAADPTVSPLGWTGLRYLPLPLAPFRRLHAPCQVDLGGLLETSDVAEVRLTWPAGSDLSINLGIGSCALATASKMSSQEGTYLKFISITGAVYFSIPVFPNCVLVYLNSFLLYGS